MPWAKRQKYRIPTLSSRKNTVEINDYSLGFNSFTSNDKFPLNNGGSNMWRKAKNARITTFGEYGTRKGVDRYSGASGGVNDQVNMSTTGASTFEIDNVNRIAQKITLAQNGHIQRVDVNIKNINAGTGTVMLEIWSDSGDKPAVLLSTSSIAEDTITNSFAYKPFYFFNAVQATAGTSLWLVLYVQADATGSYTLSTTTSTALSKASGDKGTTWTPNSFSINFQQAYCTSGAVKGLYRAYKSDGTKTTLFVQGTTLYKVDDLTSALTVINSSLNANATHYRFEMMNDVIYYVNSYDGYRKWDGTTDTQVNATNYKSIVEHKGMIFLVDITDPNRVYFSEFGLPESFVSTDFIEVPAPKTGDPVVALTTLNGYLFIHTQNNKFILAGDSRENFTLSEAPDQHGTYTQETVTVDKNFMYYLSSDGVYRSNGSEAQLMSENVYQEIVDLQHKDSCILQVNGGRLYMWYRSVGSPYNDECLVWNLNFSGKSDTVESRDTKAFVSRAFAGFNDNNTLIVGSSIVGQVFWQEKSDNDYTNAGGLIEFELATNYMSFVSPAILKEIRYWEPRFSAKSKSYAISCEYAYDLRENWTLYKNQNIQGTGEKYGSGITFGSGALYGTTSELQSYLYVPGEYRRIALRYKHFATRQPHSFLGHTLVVETRRIR